MGLCQRWHHRGDVVFRTGGLAYDRIETKLLIAFYSQTDEQIERTNQELKQYLIMYIDHRQSNWSEWLATLYFYSVILMHIL